MSLVIAWIIVIGISVGFVAFLIHDFVNEEGMWLSAICGTIALVILALVLVWAVRTIVGVPQ
jgi:hypothetical protein